MTESGLVVKSFNRNIFAILCIVFAAFSFSIRGSFLNWDDDTHLYKNEQIQPLSVPTIAKIFTGIVNETYIPLTTLSFAIEHQLFGLKPWIYHLNNILLHLGVVYLVYVLGGLLGLSEASRLLASLLFGLHPLHVESVTWVTERKDVLYSFFYTAALILYVKYLKENKRNFYWLGVLSGILAILSKAMALSLPLVLFCFDWFLLRKKSLALLFDKIPFFLTIIPIAWITYALNARVLAVNLDSGPLIWIWTFAFYIRKFIWPLELVPLYDLPKPISLFNPEYAIAVSVFSIFIFCLWSGRKNRWWMFSAVFFFLSIFFLLRFDNLKDTNIVADRFMYLPCLGFCFFLSNEIDRYLKSGNPSKVVSLIAKGSLVFLFGFLFVKTYIQTKIWKDNISFWNYTIGKYETSARSHNHRGVAFVENGEYELAIKDFSRAMELRENYLKATCNRGDTYMLLGKYDLALPDLNKTLQIDNRYERALSSRGVLFSKTGFYDEALQDLTEVLNLNPQSIKDYNNRGVVYKNQGKYDLAKADFSKVIELSPNFFPAYINRAKVNELSGDISLCLKDLNQAVTLQPKNNGLYLTRANIFLKLNRFEDALKDLDQILAIDSRSAIAYYNKAVIFSLMKNQAEAMKNFELAKNLGYPDGKSTISPFRKEEEMK